MTMAEDEQLKEGIAQLAAAWAHAEQFVADSGARPTYRDHQIAFLAQMEAANIFFRDVLSIPVPLTLIRGLLAMKRVVEDEQPSAFFLPERTREKLNLGANPADVIAETARGFSAAVMQLLIDDGHTRAAAAEKVARALQAGGYDVTARTVGQWRDEARVRGNPGNSAYSNALKWHQTATEPVPLADVLANLARTIALTPASAGGSRRGA
jgi:hypothetical protein